MYCVHIVFILLWCLVFQAPTLFSKPLSGWCEGPQDAVKDTGFPRFWDQDIFRAIRLIPLSDVQRDRSQYWETYPTWVPRKALRGRKKTRKEPRCDTWKASITSVKHDFLHLSTTFSWANSNTLQKVNELWGQSWFSHPCSIPGSGWKIFRQAALPGHLFGMQGVVGDEKRSGKRSQSSELLQPPAQRFGINKVVPLSTQWCFFSIVSPVFETFNYDVV